MPNTPKTIVLVEDEALILENYMEILEEEGYQVRGYPDRQTAFEGITQAPPDLVVLDIGLGHEREGGLELCRQLREIDKKLPIIFLTSHQQEEQRVAGMRFEVDDYIVKGESIDYLIVRVATLFRRLESLTNEEGQEEQLKRGDLRLNLETNTAWWKDRQLNITLTQFCILKELAIIPGQTRTVSRLMSAANVIVEPNTIVANIKNIRKRFREIDPGFDQIRAEYGVGYRWVSG